jgi:hypothetical protein
VIIGLKVRVETKAALWGMGERGITSTRKLAWMTTLRINCSGVDSLATKTNKENAS